MEIWRKRGETLPKKITKRQPRWRLPFYFVIVPLFINKSVKLKLSSNKKVKHLKKRGGCVILFAEGVTPRLKFFGGRVASQHPVGQKKPDWFVNKE